MKKLFVLFAGLSLTAAATAQGNWTLDKAHSSVNFTVTHMMVSDVSGYFKDISADIKSDKADFSDLNVNVTIQVGSVNTDNEKRDAHIKSPDFFDAEKYATITFKSTSVKKISDKKYEMEGDLTLHGVTKKVKWALVSRGPVDGMDHKPHAGFKATTTINRQDYGVGASAPDAMVSTEVTLTVNAEIIKK